MSEWKEFKIGEITKKATSGGTPSTKVEEYYGGNIPWLNTKEVNFNRIWSTEKFITEKGLNNSAAKWIDQNSVIVAMYGATAAKVAINKIPLTTNQACCNLIIDYKRANYEFVFYYIWNKYEELENIAVGAAQQNLSVGVIADFPISLPPLPEQAAIASVLSSLDDKIDLLHRQNATLEKMAETLFRQWFVEEAKEEWDEKSLGELLTITSSKRIFYSEYVSSGIPFYRSKEIIELRNSGSTSSELFISNERFNEIDSKFGSPKEGDILMTSVGTLGVAYRVKANEKFYFKDGNLTWFKDFKELPSSVIYLWLISKIGQEELSAITIGSTQQALTIEGLKSISFKIPPKEVVSICQKQFDDIISKIDSNQTQIRTLTALRDTLLPKLMSGEVKVEMS
jgi:type I restriction enzyme S subunit